MRQQPRYSISNELRSSSPANIHLGAHFGLLWLLSLHGSFAQCKFANSPFVAQACSGAAKLTASSSIYLQQKNFVWLNRVASSRNSIKTINFSWFSAIGSQEASDQIEFFRNALRSRQTANNRFSNYFAAALTAITSIEALRNACYSVRFCWKTAQSGSREPRIDNYGAANG